MAGDEDEVYIHYGTPLVSEEDLNPRKRKTALDQGQARHVAPWNQEVTDSEGRRRFHGAFSGGFSAGYFNTVGSKEGWTPQTFTSSRKARANRKEQAAYDFMDEDEKAQFDAKNLGIRSEFDTFGSTAAEYARRQAIKEIGDRPSAIPGPLIDEIIIPANRSTGVKLLIKMGWRQGRQIGPKHIAAASGARREARKAMMSFAQNESGSKVSSGPEEPVEAGEGITLEDEEEIDIEVPQITPSFVLNPKNDLYGLGYDPFKNAPEFRDRKRAREEDRSGHGGWKGHALSLKKPSLFRPNVGKMGGGFGIGALEDLGEEDEDVYDQGMEFEVQELEGEEKPAAERPQKRLLEDPLHKGSVLPGFHVAKEPSKKKPWFPPPIIPKNFDFVHKFEKPLHSERLIAKPAPPEAQPPDNPELCKYIEGLASFVAKSGPRLEAISKEKQSGNPMFSFLFGGLGHDYYVRRLWEEEQKLVRDGKQQIHIGAQRSEEPGRVSRFSAQLGADERGKMLGEIPLPKGAASVKREDTPVASMVGADDRARLQSALSSTFTSSSKAEVAAGKLQPFKNDPAKQRRFEQFMKDKSVGGLWKPTSGGSGLSEARRSQEIFEFEAVARMQQDGLAPEQRIPQHFPSKTIPEMAAMMGSRFTTGGVEITTLALQETSVSNEIVLREGVKQYPRREENSWRPAPMLCKRFDLLDPYAGKPPPLPKPRSRTESFILLTNPLEGKTEFHPPPSQATAIQNSTVDDLNILEQEGLVEDNIHLKDDKMEAIPERPVDLYKAIFSDDSDDEDDVKHSQTSTQVGPIPGSVNANKSSEAANAALNRLAAGDFLESLGKELGLKVPETSRPTGDRLIAKETDGGDLGRRMKLAEHKGSELEQQGRLASKTARDQSRVSLHSETGTSGHQLHTNGVVAEKLPHSESHQTSSRGGQLQSESGEALFGVRTRYLHVPDNTSRGADVKSDANPRENDNEARVVVAPSTVYPDTKSDLDSDKGKALAKEVRREERRLKREKDKRKHNHRKDRNRDKSSRKRKKSREKEGRHNRKHKRRRSESSSGTSSSS